MIRARLATARGRPAGAKAGAAGFTLLELLVAAGLLAMMGLILSVSISSIMSAIRESRETQDRYHAARVALGRMQREIAMAYLSKHQGEARTTKTVFLGKPDSLVFTYLGHRRLVRGSRETDQGVVEYSLQRGDEGRLNLVRREKVIIDDQPEKDGRRQVLATDVLKLRFEYWDMDREDWEGDWKVEIDRAAEEQRQKELAAATAAATTGNAALGQALADMQSRDDASGHGPDDQWLPSRVRIYLVLGTETGDELEFVTETRIRMQQAIDFNG
jgi:general secretion pathway protein J